MNSILLVITTLFTGLMAGLFYSWSISVTPGLAKLGDEKYLSAFQSMNRAIINPSFLIVFMGLVILLILLSYFSYNSPTPVQFWYVLSATVLYLAGVMLVTFLGNIPLNNTLEALKIETMSAEQMASFRLAFESKWNTFNTIRTICSSLSFLSLVIACTYNGSI
ncbi:MAG: DUF1772 domain-containing protein [Ignavibacteriaceae bacterium]|nr:DUF1772 domain-containing protein [Ignavibacteriaceae bacterium]